MSTRTRVVYFINDPYSEARTAVAALLQAGDETSVLRATLPRLRPSAESVVDRALTDLEREPNFDALPIGAGPHFTMGEPHSLPKGVADPGRWVLDHLLRTAA